MVAQLTSSERQYCAVILIVMALAGWAVAFSLFSRSRRRVVHYL